MLLGLSPWVILGVVLAFIAGVGGAYWYGHSSGVTSTNAKWQIAIDQQKIAADAILKASQDRVAAAERANTDLSNQLETDHAKAVDAINTAVSTALQHVASGSVLIDAKGRGYCRTNPVSGNNGAISSPEPASAGCELSSDASRDLTTLAGRADTLAAYAKACHDWAMQVPAMCHN